jgi:hypothetical protein
MILCTHNNPGFNNTSKGHSHAGAHIFISKNNPFFKHNGPILSISQIMKFVKSSATEAELGALYTAAKELVPSNKSSLKWVGPNHAHPSKQTTSLPLVSPTSPLSCKKANSWISSYGVSTAESLNNSSATTGIRVVTTGQTTTPSTTHQSTTKQTDPPMPVQQPNYLEPLPLSGPAAFIR